jgi:polysaccharide biosynthesis/export protein
LKQLLIYGRQKFGEVQVFNIKTGLILAACAMLSGCGLAPGQHLDVYNHTARVMPSTPLANVTLVPVDDAVVAQQVAYQNNFDYRVEPQDVLNITVWDHPELTIPAGQYRSASESGILVDGSGNIFYPFAGMLHVGGLTVQQVRVKLSQHLSKYIQAPQVSVRVAMFASQKIQVLGAVEKPKTEPLTNVPMSLMDAINAAGGFDPLAANAKNVFILRGPMTHPKLFWLNENNPTALLLAGKFYLRDDDVVFVSTAGIARLQKVLSPLSSVVMSASYIHDLNK